ncbi:hypothetical protein, partial [Alistipes sp. An66]|uniref:hypothetical protein n=1 Tax=Alistipes sp. An66 TaxID=1965650 RepID=UPI001952314C
RVKTITQKEEQHAAACCSETKNRYICISEESEGTSPDTLLGTVSGNRSWHVPSEDRPASWDTGWNTSP